MNEYDKLKQQRAEIERSGIKGSAKTLMEFADLIATPQVTDVGLGSHARNMPVESSIRAVVARIKELEKQVDRLESALVEQNV